MNARAVPVLLLLATIAAAQEERDGGAFVGVLVDAATVDVSVPGAGRLVSVAVEVGDRVEAGAVVARCDDGELRREVEIAAADLATSAAELRKAELAQDAAREHHARVVAQGDLVPDKERAAAARAEVLAASDLEIARARLAAQRGRRDLLEARAEQCALRAPCTGTVVARYADAGARLGADAPVLRIAIAGPLLVRFAVPPQQRARWEVGASVEVTLRDDVGRRASAIIRRIWPELDSACAMRFVEAELDAAAGGWTSGGVVDVRQPAAAAPAEVRR